MYVYIYMIIYIKLCIYIYMYMYIHKCVYIYIYIFHAPYAHIRWGNESMGHESFKCVA